MAPSLLLPSHRGVLPFNDFLELMGKAEYVALDTETTGEEIRDGRGYCIGISLSFRVPGVGYISDYFPIRHKHGGNTPREDIAKLARAIESLQVLVMHNAKFDLVSLATAGINYENDFYDTMLIAHLINENQPVGGKGLDALGKYYLRDEGKKKSPDFIQAQKAFGWDMPVEFMREYATYDAELTLRLSEHLRELAAREPGLLENVWRKRQDFVRLIIRMESRGVRIDTDLCERQILLGSHAMEDVREILQLNPGSPKDLKELLIDQLGLPPIYKKRKNNEETLTFDKEAMKRYEEMLARLDDPTAEQILRYRGWQKSISSNYQAYLDLLSPDGRLRPNYKLHGTRTGRMSCEKPNLQQIPRVSDKPWNGGMKKAFIPHEGYSLIEADYSQLELRLGSAYGRVEPLLHAFVEGRDVFSDMAEQLGMARQDVKTLTYTIQYGGGINRLCEVFGVSPSRAAAIRDNFYAQYPGFRVVSNHAQNHVKKSGSIRLWTGRQRHFLYRNDEAHKAFNSVIQGGAADIVERTMLRLGEEVDSDACRMLLQVHDSVVFEVRDDVKEDAEREIARVMADVPGTVGEDWGVKFAVDVHEWGH